MRQCDNSSYLNAIMKYQTTEENFSLQWRHNGRDSVSNHQPHDCLLNRLLRRIFTGDRWTPRRNGQ